MGFGGFDNFGGFDGFGGLGGYGGFSDIFNIMFIIFIVGAIFTAVMMGLFSIRILSVFRKDDKSPRLTVEATVVAKRAPYGYHRDVHGNMRFHRSSNRVNYYATFEVTASGDRMELLMSETEYGLLVEGDYGKLTFKGRSSRSKK